MWTTQDTTNNNKLSTSVSGAFDLEPQVDFNFKAIDDDIFRGQLFTIEQCGQLNRM